MNKKIIINSTLNELRVAITEDEELAEFFIELPDREKYIGNIYLGKVNKIVTGINAAFINIGLNQDAFLHFSDVDQSLEESVITDEEDEDLPDKKKKNYKKQTKPNYSGKNKKGNGGDSNSSYDSLNATDIALRKVAALPDSKEQPTFVTKKSGEVKINLEPKQDIIVQVVREPYGNKGVKVTTKIALPGRYVVLLPFESLIGVSRKIGTYNERKRLRSIARKALPEGFGCIIRTAAKGQSDEELRRDWEELLNTWREIENKVRKSKSPALLYQDMQLAASVIRDLFTYKIDKVVVDSKKLHKEIINYLKRTSPDLIDKVQIYNGTKPIFETFGIERELEKTYKRKVPLPSGGSIVFDHTEAMFVIDVNSGRSMDAEQEKNALNTNLEAVKEITRQIRLRDIGGMIIIDFIDMSNSANRKKMFNEMKNELQKDRAKTVVYPTTQLGLIQMTRQRINQNIVEKTSEICPTCNGSGRVTSKVVVLNMIERWLKNFRGRSKEFRLTLEVHPSVAEYLTDGTISRLSRLMIKYFVKIKIRQAPNLNVDDFRFISARQQKDITKEFL